MLKLLWVSLTLLIGAGVARADAAKLHLAICASGDERAAKLVALIEVGLSKSDNLELVDRANIDKALKEQNLALDGVMSAESVLSLGRFLKCDIFAEIHSIAVSREMPATTILVMFDAVTGARLCDKAFSFEDALDAQSAEVQKSIEGAASKCERGRIEGGGLMMSLMEVVGLDLPDEAKRLPEIISMMLERELLRSTEVSIVERRRLDTINAERALTDQAQDKLLASTVRIDVDILRLKTDAEVEVRANLSDISGKVVGLVRVEGQVNSPVDIISALAVGILKELSAARIEPDPLACRNEAARLLADERLFEKRGEKDRAKVAAAAAMALAETALLQVPDDISAQKFAAMFIIRYAADVENPWDVIALLERYIELSEKWPAEKSTAAKGYVFDTRTYLRAFSKLLREALGELKGLPSQENADNPRLKALRERYGRWNKAMDASDWCFLVYLSNIELWANNVDEMLDDADKYLNFRPPELILQKYFGRSQPTMLHPIESYTAAQKRRLLGLYQKWGEMRQQYMVGDIFKPFASSLSGAVLINTFPEDFEHPEQLIDAQLLKAIDLAVQTPTMSGSFVQFMVTQDVYKWHPSWKPFSQELADGMVDDLRKRLEAKKVLVPEVYIFLDEKSSRLSKYPGEFLEMAGKMLASGAYHLPQQDGKATLHVEPELERLSNLHMDKYGSGLIREERSTNVISEAGSEAVFKASEGSEIVAMAWKDDSAYLLLFNKDYSEHEVRKVGLLDGLTTSLGKLRVESPFVKKTRMSVLSKGISCRFDMVPQISVGESTVTIPTPGGLIIFRKDATKPQLLTSGDGLPVDLVTASCEAAGALYIGCRGEQDGYLVKSRLDGTGAEVLACSGRQEKRSDLDATMPFIVESIVGDTAENRLFIVALVARTWTGWLYALNLETGKICCVFKKHDFLRQLRLVGKEQYFVRVHSNTSNYNNMPGYWGYGIWNSSAYKWSPMGGAVGSIEPIAGSIHPDLRNWTNGKPSFSVHNSIVPSSTASMALLDKNRLIASDEKAWQIIERSDAGGRTQALPSLDACVPFSIQMMDGSIFACTTGGLWRVSIRFEDNNTATNNEPSAAEESSAPSGLGTHDTETGTLVVDSLPGSDVTVDGKTWKIGVRKPFTWNGMSVGAHNVSISFADESKFFAVVIEKDKTTLLKERFGEADAKKMSVALGSDVAMEFVWIPQCSTNSCGDIWMSKYEVTQQQYSQIMATNPSPYRAGDYPVSGIGNLAVAQVFCQKFTETIGSSNRLTFRVPTEEEWSYALNGESTNRYYSGNSQQDLLSVAWLKTNSQGSVHPVGLKMPNQFWLYDMIGNVEEWTTNDKCPCGGGYNSQTPEGWKSRESTGIRIVAVPDK